MKIICLLLFLLFGIIITLWILASRFVSTRKADQIHFVKTKDHWPIALHRYLPRQKGSGLHPVILCHGLGANRFNFDLDDNISLASDLADLGYDVFLIELRGVGFSKREKMFYPGKWDICFDDFIEKDIPAAIDYVLNLTNYKKVHWIGHSMGGMVAYAFCQLETSKKIKSVCAVASPGNLVPLKRFFTPLLRIMFLAKPFPVLHQAWFMKLYTPFATIIKRDFFSKFLFNRKVMSTEIMGKVSTNLISDVPFKLLMQFGKWLSSDEMSSLAGYDYRANYHKIKSPFLFISGQNDVLAKYETVSEVFEKVSSKVKKHVHLSKAGGSTDFGHGDIVLSDAAKLEVYPLIINWIEDQN